MPSPQTPPRGRRLNRISIAVGRIPKAAWICAVIAFANAACWSFITPPFQSPDEPAHFAYVQYLAETGHLPLSGGSRFAPAEIATLNALGWVRVRARPENGTIASAAEQSHLEQNLTHGYSRVGIGEAGLALNEPPLYYALQTIPYELASSGTLLDQLALMRLLSAMMAGFTALFAFLFIREALPAFPYTWTVGGLGVALAPLLGFMSGAVNPDVMLYAVASALYLSLARAFRRGLTHKRAAAIGAVLAIGLFTKLNFIALLPGTFIGLLLLARRVAARSKRSALGSVAITTAITAIPVLVYVARNLAASHPSLGIVSSGAKVTTKQGSITHEISYIWQLYLPRLPGMPRYFPGVSTIRQFWFDGLVGRYGWLDTTFAGWVYSVALVPVALLAVLVIRALTRQRTRVRDRAAEVAVYGVMGTGVMVLVGAADYLGYPNLAGGYVEARYLLPMIVLWGAFLALGVRGAGHRYGPAIGTAIVMLALAHDLFSQMLVISRYYG